MVHLRFAILYVLLLGTWVFLSVHRDSTISVVKPLNGFPSACSQWRMITESRFDESVLQVLKPTDYLSRVYAGATGTKVGLYVGYHDGGKGSGEIHSPRNCLPGSGWTQLSAGRVNVATPAGDLRVARGVYQKGETRELFLYWFQVRGKPVADEYSLKLAEVTGSLLHGRRDAAFIRVSIPFEGDENTATTEGITFIRDFHPFLREFLPI